ncbi:DNA-binding protein [Sulfuricaulis limicola]|uniref:DNA-binding protein n=1 Tax=Sulfuricaulis limicola TaxID=1620215 RepID=A0A1B4XJI6_9GAMM|nr:mobile mystery protein A [Sulfuricaulis limicola]BAV34954.1 DNA-binding protein [Sulfuricaulis limicola]
MVKKYQKTALEQLDASLVRFAPLRDLPPPKKGWIRAIRDALGMSGRQLGRRMGVSKMWVGDMERLEASGATTLKTLRRAAEAMDCMLVYAIVPKTTLKDTLLKQARQKVRQDLARASHTMALEDQALAKDEAAKATEAAAASLLHKLPKTFWD